MKKLFIIGSGGFSKQVIELVETINEKSKEFELIGLIDDNHNLIGGKVLGYKVIGTVDYLLEYSKKHKVYAVIAIGDGTIRRRISQKLQTVTWVNLIHSSAVISKYIEMGKGNIICAGSVINPDCRLGNHCHINIGTTMGHDVFMHDFVTVMPGSNISGNVQLKQNSMIGTGAKVIQGLTIEESVVLGAGAVLTKNTEKYTTYIGIPAKKYQIDTIDKERLGPC